MLAMIDRRRSTTSRVENILVEVRQQMGAPLSDAAFDAVVRLRDSLTRYLNMQQASFWEPSYTEPENIPIREKETSEELANCRLDAEHCATKYRIPLRDVINAIVVLGTQKHQWES